MRNVRNYFEESCFRVKSAKRKCPKWLLVRCRAGLSKWILDLSAPGGLVLTKPYGNYLRLELNYPNSLVCQSLLFTFQSKKCLRVNSSFSYY